MVVTQQLQEAQSQLQTQAQGSEERTKLEARIKELETERAAAAARTESLRHMMAAETRRRKGFEQQASDLHETIERAVELDPRDIVILQQLSLNYQSLRRYGDMTAVLDRALTIAPNDVALRALRAGVALDWRADQKPLHTTIQTILTDNPKTAPVCRMPRRFRARRARAASK